MFRARHCATDLAQDSSIATKQVLARSASEPSCAPAFAASILVGEADQTFYGPSTHDLKSFGYDVHARRRGADALTCVSARGWRAVVLNFDAPDEAHLGILHQIRVVSDVPIVLIGVDVVTGLEAGADACLPKDCSAHQLLACLQAIMRRATPNADILRQNTLPDTLVFADLRIVPRSRQVTLAGRVLSLTPREFDLLLSLAKAHGQVKSRDDLYNELVDRDYRALDRAIDVQVSCLRRKLGDDPKHPRFIRTIRSAGYMLVHPVL